MVFLGWIQRRSICQTKASRLEAWDEILPSLLTLNRMHVSCPLSIDHLLNCQMRQTSNTIEKITLWKHVHPLWITIFQIGSGYARPANQLHDPNVLGNAPIVPTREDL